MYSHTWLSCATYRICEVMSTYLGEAGLTIGAVTTAREGKHEENDLTCAGLVFQWRYMAIGGKRPSYIWHPG